MYTEADIVDGLKFEDINYEWVVRINPTPKTEYDRITISYTRRNNQHEGSFIHGMKTLLEDLNSGRYTVIFPESVFLTTN